MKIYSQILFTCLISLFLLGCEPESPNQTGSENNVDTHTSSDTQAPPVTETQTDSQDEVDSDGDSVIDSKDNCSQTQANLPVDINGCAINQLDEDNDLVIDALDKCAQTRFGAAVDDRGCAIYQLDSDFDGVNDSIDRCPNSPIDEMVDTQGCQLLPIDEDSDADGVLDSLDLCINTGVMVSVDVNGCGQNQLDDDNDSVFNDVDQCLDTQESLIVDANGCSQHQLDDDNDGFVNAQDQCPNTIEVAMDNGCSQIQLDAMKPIDDADEDGVQDSDDFCAMTTIGANVTQRGCSDLQEGSIVYAEKCSTCHGDNGQGGREIQIQNCTFDDLDCTNFEELRRYNSNAMPKFNDNSCRNDCAIWVTTYSIDAFVIFENDDDKDNVKNNIDLCPNTVWFDRNSVLENGCTVENSNVGAQVEAYFINVGGAAYMAVNGDEYQADDYFVNGNSDSSTADIENTSNDGLYQTNRWAKNLNYDLPIKNGEYEVSLSFAETHFTSSAKRQFDIVFEGQQQEANFDIFEASGKVNRAKTKKYVVTVEDEFLTIELNATINNALLSAIKVVASVETPVMPIDYSKYKKGLLMYSEDFEDNDITPWDFGKAENGVYKVWKVDDGSHAQTARLYTKSDNEYVPPKTNVDIFPEHITNAIIEFDYKALKYMDPQTGEEYGPPSVNFVIDDKHSSAYTHAGHISRVSVYSSGKILIRDDVGGVFGKRQAEKIIKDRDGDADKYNEIVSQYYNDDILKTKQKNADAGILPNIWVKIRIVMFGPRMELWVDDKLVASLESPGLLDLYSPIKQPVKAFAESFGREQLQPRGLDHYKNKFGFTVNPGQIHIDNVKIWTVGPL